MTKPKRFTVGTDSHGDMQDDHSVASFLAFVHDFKPDIRIHAGDAFDFRNLRRGASDDEKASSLEDDWQMGSDFLMRYFDGGKENHLLLGNHDDRLWQFRRSATGLLRDYASDGIKRVEALCARRKIKTLPYDSALGILSLGKLNVLHGYHAGASAARQHANIYGNCLFGHVHTDEVAPVASLEPAEARSIPSLCIRDMDYINAKTGKLRHSNGWAYGFLFEDGTYQLFIAKKINGSFHVASEIKTY